MDAIKKIAINSNSSDDLVRNDLEAMTDGEEREDELNAKGFRLYHIYIDFFFFDLCQEIFTTKKRNGYLIGKRHVP